MTTTIRVRPSARDRFRAIAEADGRSMLDTVDEAVAALERRRRIEASRRQLDELRRDPDAWADYVAELDSLPVGDGIA